jgi:hypothetical protein
VAAGDETEAIGATVGVEGDLVVVVVDFGVAKRSSSSSIEAAAAAEEAVAIGRPLLDGGALRGPALALSLNGEIRSIDQKNAMKLLEAYHSSFYQ